MEEKLLATKEILKKYGQEHLLENYENLSEENKNVLLNDILTIDFGEIAELYEQTKHKVEFENCKIEPIDHVEKAKLSDEELRKYSEIGIQEIKKGKLAAVTMAGGQGTRLGHNGPKGTFDLGLESHKSIFEILCDTLKLAKKQYDVVVPWYIMTSDENNDETVKFFEENNYFDYPKEAIKFFKTFYGTTFKDNLYLEKTVLTGVSRVAKESIFSGANNFDVYTVLDDEFSDDFGITEEEMDKVIKDFEVEDQKEEIKKWYDGYHFGDFDVYCPWDVMNYLLELQRNPNAKPISYWKNTSDNAIIRSFIDYAGSTITNKLETLMAGGYIVQRVDENLTYDYLHSSEDNLWSTLYLTGYLTKAREEDYKGELPDGMVALMIPNAEIKEIFETTVIKWFDDSTKKWNRNALFDAVWNGDSEGITKEMNALLRRTISYHDYREDFYHAFLAGIFTGAGYMVDSNKEHGEGRSDVVVYDSINARVAIFEAKYTKVLENLESECDIALQQIDDRMYAKEYEDDYDQILCYGISFFKKRCMVKKK